VSADLEADGAAGAGPHAPVGSPCTSVCRMDADGVYCIGCLRTLDEIAGWASFDDERRRQIWKQLSQRRMQAAQAQWMRRR
jgi:predicted Fe-S protein YdhL (DUF1289 family)